jgi:Pheromone A receptor
MWPCLLSFIAIIFGMLSLRAFLKRRAMVEEFLNSNASGLNADRYFRLMCFASAELVIAFPLGLYQLLLNIYNNPMFPWISWDNTHSNFNRFDQFPALFFYVNNTLLFEFGLSLWCIPFLSYIFFLFFGIGREQLNQYKRWFYILLKPFGVKPPAPKPYNPHGRSWLQKLFRFGASTTTTHGTGLTSSRGATDSLPAFRHGGPQVSHGEKPIPSARSKHALSSIDVELSFDYDEKVDDIVDAKHLERSADMNVHKSLPLSPLSPTVVGSSSSASSEQGDDDKYRRNSRMSTSSAEGSERRASPAIRTVELSHAEIRAIETRVQRMV